MTLQREISSKHSPGSKSKAHKSSKHSARKWSPDESVPLCSARAVAEAVRLASGPVLSDAEVLSLHWAAGGDRDGGATLSDVLSAAQALVGLDPAWVLPVPATAPVAGRVVPPNFEGAVGVDGTMPVIGSPEEDPVVGATARQHALNGDACLAGVPASSPLGNCLPSQALPPVSFGPDLPWSDSNRRGPYAPALAPGRSITAGCLRHRQPGRTRCGLFGYASKPGSLSLLLGLDLPLLAALPAPYPAFDLSAVARASDAPAVTAERLELGTSPARALPHAHPLILGLDLPWGEPHAVTVAPDGTWWSWGQPCDPDDFPGYVIEEAWAVTC
jgi:hypothetical protein